MSILLSQVVDLTKHYIIHALPFKYEGAQCPLLEEKTLVDRVRVLRWLAPTISASSFSGEAPHTGSDYSNARFGVLLAQGEIQNAFSKEAGIVANFRGERVSGVTQTKEEIVEAVQGRVPGSVFNELIVAQPQLSGVYFSVDGDVAATSAAHHVTQLLGRLEAMATFSGPDDAIQEAPLPMFIIIKGQVRPFLGFNDYFASMVLSDFEQKSFDKTGQLSQKVSNLDELRQESWVSEMAGCSLADMIESCCDLGPSLDHATLQLLAERNIFDYRKKAYYGLKELGIFKDSYRPAILTQLKSFESLANSLGQPEIDEEVKSYDKPKNVTMIGFQVGSEFASLGGREVFRYSPHLPPSKVEFNAPPLILPPITAKD